MTVIDFVTRRAQIQANIPAPNPYTKQLEAVMQQVTEMGAIGAYLTVLTANGTRRHYKLGDVPSSDMLDRLLDN